MKTGAFNTCLIALAGAAMTSGAEPDFVKDIKPILEVRCVKCHGPSKMEGELDLSNKDGALVGGELGPAIVDGNVEESILMQRIVKEKDDEEVMPSKGRLLTMEEIEKIRSWIKAGAAWPQEIALEEVKEAKDAQAKDPEVKEAESNEAESKDSEGDKSVRSESP